MFDALVCLFAVLPIRRMPRAARGQGLVEYALILALVSVVVIAALLVLGPSISRIFTHINSTL